MTHEPWTELADLHALGALDGKELKRFKAHLEDERCPECRARVLETERALASIPALASAAATPPITLKTAVLSRIADAETPLPQAGIPSVWWGIPLAAVAVAAMLWIGNPFPKAALPGEGHAPALASLLAEPATQVVRLTGLEPHAHASAQMTWNSRAGQGCFKVTGLKAIPENKAFQLWAIPAEGAPVSVGVFRADADGRAHADFPALAQRKDFAKFAVTVEPAGGVPQPTGAMQLLGSFS